ncbi:uncharacterized protein LOC123931033 isoform X2 [Meles meles]|uniref:uncharacterized protein LOC123931033 isoform X2 n=1 Tax=Meles meles TaxID=9662 RepID=UPI001E698A13|nr:uncharacterized protein LOC123931033 isoform X2 [Meles meles]
MKTMKLRGGKTAGSPGALSLWGAVAAIKREALFLSPGYRADYTRISEASVPPCGSQRGEHRSWTAPPTPRRRPPQEDPGCALGSEQNQGSLRIGTGGTETQTRRKERSPGTPHTSSPASLTSSSPPRHRAPTSMGRTPVPRVRCWPRCLLGAPGSQQEPAVSELHRRYPRLPAPSAPSPGSPHFSDGHPGAGTELPLKHAEWPTSPASPHQLRGRLLMPCHRLWWPPERVHTPGPASCGWDLPWRKGSQQLRAAPGNPRTTRLPPCFVSCSLPSGLSPTHVRSSRWAVSQRINFRVPLRIHSCLPCPLRPCWPTRTDSVTHPGLCSWLELAVGAPWIHRQ